ncbi:MAG: biopolymer transporter ExbD [Flavobacteriales bacterium]|jgi:biopolymer transport protein ExbD|nr:biopolymer transporter ExbD [Flavobacteriales bacterium]MCB0757914.1 biopolymer transporter ExbD [Flavobacteriales bacterium]
MAEVPGGDEGGGGGRHKKKRAKKGSTRIDMTPLVDLAFLLLTFFILTTTMYQPSSLQLTFPVPQDGADKRELEKVNNALTVFLTKEDQIFYYRDAFKPGETQLTRTDFSKITKFLIDENRSTFDQVQELGRRYNANEIDQLAYDTLKNNVQKRPEALFVIIKPDKDAKYRNMIDMVDDMDISGIGKYAVQDTIKPVELELLNAEKLKF